MFLPPSSRSNLRVDSSLRWLLGIFLAGLLLVIGLRVFFSGWQEELRDRSANERARLFVGEEIVRGIHGIEKDLYRMVVTGNTSGLGRIEKDVRFQLTKLRHDLSVLKDGGTVKREALLNLEGRDAMIREVTYKPSPGDSGYVMETIEIGPLLDQIPERSAGLAKLLARRWDCVEREDRRCLYDTVEEISIFVKHFPPLFERLDENANRLFFDSSERLRTLEAELVLQRERLSLVESGLIALVVILAGLAALLVVRRINVTNLAREAALAQARAARDEAERASRAKSEFVSRMSHELRTPLNAIIGFAQLLEAEPLPPSQLNYVNLINSSGQHLMELINAVLDHAKIEAGGMVLEKISYDFPAMVEAVRTIVAERAAEKGLEFITVVSDDLPRHVQGDPTRMRQILINLLVNAVKFTERGSVELRVARDEQQLVFSIRDSGIGMSDEALGRLFKPFGQADESITRKFGGTGLGLMISKDLVEAMGGTIEVESAPGAGTCFWIRVPLTRGDAADAQPLPQIPAEDMPLANLIQGRVLLVDDNRVNRELGSAMLGRLGLTFDMAENGVECLRRVTSADYSLVLMDMEMPEMDGLTATKRIREREKAEGLPRLTIIAMTANALQEDRERCFAVGMDGYISKPVSLSSLQSEIRRLFGAGGSPAPSAGKAVSSKTGEIYNRALMIEMLGDEELVNEIAALYVADAESYCREIDEAIATADWPRLARGAHTVKGLFATFSAAGFEGEAHSLERAASAGDAATCQSLGPVVSAHIRSLAAALA